MTRSYWTGQADAAELAHWEAVATEAAARLAVDALDRDRANLDPTAELELLRDAGLVNLLDPAEFGGGGAHWETAFRVIRILSRADASVAQVLAYHYINSGNIGFAVAPERQPELYRRTIDGRWVWGDSVNPVDPDLTLTDLGDGRYRLDGTKRFSTGASAGDIVLAAATIAGGDRAGTPVFVLLDHDRPGIRYHGDWDALGQRLSASGSVSFDGVAVAEADILGELSDEPFSTLITPGIQLAFGNLYLGIAEGALAKARELTLARTNSWFLSGVDRYAEDPFVLRVFGELLSRIEAVEALADAVGREFDAVVDAGENVTAEDRGRLAQRIARLKVVSTEVSIEVTTRVFEVTGSSSARASVGLDLWWRNVRTHTLHDPVDYKKLEVGAYYVNGDLQPISLYT
ncbi:acyl-CoA dehydrogenase family protein [Leifsonia sp. 21MFCrub1.1]|uniref:acyl-CoA dehydrogenase family protein n=1 Tax=Leifsonia sp. 21MFCrub1.1 TaxID=1798223 RepID=UPI00089282E7|nr:acyl-CoA dehydrogenase family protein [Leifsonia sp. 21MFCrub1.1]SEA81854.1 Acyl-CoA dehydrogenase [Leifsonia sp. 21MFCrub1.1]